MRPHRALGVAAIVCAGLLTGFGSAAAQGERHIGFVLSLAGSWTVDGRRVIQGQAVPPGGQVRFAGAPAEVSSSLITIVLLNNQVLHVRCAGSRTCEQDHRLPESLLTRQSLASRLTDATMTLFGERPARYVPTLSRGLSGSPVDDGIARLNDGSLDVRSSLARLGSGRYHLRLAPPAPPAAAWILVRSGARYDEAARDYRAVESAVQLWDPDVPPSVRRSFLRASLDGLARRGQ